MERDPLSRLGDDENTELFGTGFTGAFELPPRPMLRLRDFFDWLVSTDLSNGGVPKISAYKALVPGGMLSGSHTDETGPAALLSEVPFLLSRRKDLLNHDFIVSDGCAVDGRLGAMKG